MSNKRRDPIREAFEQARPVDFEPGEHPVNGKIRATSQGSITSEGRALEQATGAGYRHADIPLVRNSKGLPVWCPATAIALLNFHSDWQGCLYHDAFLQSDMLCRPVPGTEANETFETREIKDTDIV